MTDCSEMCFHCSDEYFGLLCSPQSQEKGVNTISSCNLLRGSNSSSGARAGSLHELFTVQCSEAALLSSMVAQNAWEHWGEGGWYSNMKIKKTIKKEGSLRPGRRCCSIGRGGRAAAAARPCWRERPGCAHTWADLSGHPGQPLLASYAAS